MKRLLCMLLLVSFATSRTFNETFTVVDLLTLSALSQKDIDHFMKKKGYLSCTRSLEDSLIVTGFFQENTGQRKDTLTKRTVEVFKKNDIHYFVLNTSSMNEYTDGKRRLIEAGFFYNNKRNPGMDTSVLFQKGNITIEAITGTKDGNATYTFLLKKKELPDPNSIRHAEDLLSFNSHEYLVSFFGESNVKKDLYFFSDKELKKCSVLFSNSDRQVVFVWEDGNHLCDLSFVLISSIIPTVSGKGFNGFIGNNQWTLKNGIYCGMSLKELLRLNAKDFKFYGNQSEFGFIVEPNNSGKLDFKKYAIMLNCNNCINDSQFDATEVQAQDVAEDRLPIYVYSIIVFPVPH